MGVDDGPVAGRNIARMSWTVTWVGSSLDGFALWQTVYDRSPAPNLSRQIPPPGPGQDRAS